MRAISETSGVSSPTTANSAGPGRCWPRTGSGSCEPRAPWKPRARCESAAPCETAAEVFDDRLRRTLGSIAMPGSGPQVQAVRVVGLLRLRPELLRQMVHCRVGIDGHRIEFAHE